LFLFDDIYSRNLYVGQVNKNELNGMIRYVWIYFRFTKPSELEIQEERDSRMCSEYLHTVDVLSLRVNQLLDAINRVCVTHDI